MNKASTPGANYVEYGHENSCGGSKVLEEAVIPRPTTLPFCIFSPHYFFTQHLYVGSPPPPNENPGSAHEPCLKLGTKPS